MTCDDGGNGGDIGDIDGIERDGSLGGVMGSKGGFIGGANDRDGLKGATPDNGTIVAGVTVDTMGWVVGGAMGGVT
jgi:hypothetical protein